MEELSFYVWERLHGMEELSWLRVTNVVGFRTLEVVVFLLSLFVDLLKAHDVYENNGNPNFEQHNLDPSGRPYTLGFELRS